MAQNGVHGLIGLAVGRVAADRGALRFGLALLWVPLVVWMTVRMRATIEAM
jgi:hypothetical protein